jgi:hypothetical protein
MNKYLSRLTSSERGQKFNPLIWPFLWSTFFYGLGFLLFSSATGVGKSSLFVAMSSLHVIIPFVWGLVALATIVLGFTFLLFNIPPVGQISGLVGFMVWLFAGFCWTLTGGWLLLLTIAAPNMYFWFWQYFSLSFFDREGIADKKTMKAYDSGGYDNEDARVDGKQARLNNRGAKRQ